MNTREKFNQIWFSFPIQLLLLHIKRNHFLLIFWFILFGIINQWFFTKYGIHTLFTTPEYLGNSDIFAYGILGAALGGFIMAFHLYTYVTHGFRFRFLLSVSRPFFKFSLNNFVIPMAFYINFLILSTGEQIEMNGGKLTAEVILNLTTFSFGMFAFIGLTFLYFLSTNKDALSFWNSTKSHLDHREEKIESTLKRVGKIWRVDTYINFPLKISHARDVTYYKDDIIVQVMRQNYMNGSIFELITISTFITFGFLLDSQWFALPAGASILLLFTTVFMCISAFFSLFKGWSITFILIIFLGLQVASMYTNIFKLHGVLPGLDYDTPASNYPPNPPSIQEFQLDYQTQLSALNSWKEKNTILGGEKPKLVLINCSGGGMRSALWTFGVLEKIHHATRGDIFNKAFLISGSSGGMIGASYYRQLVLDSIITPHEIDWLNGRSNISKDLLNPITASMVMRDFFLRFQTYKYQDKRYLKDRAYAFDRQLNVNTNYILEKPLGFYTLYEQTAIIPTVILSPSNAADGRRILISSSSLRHFQVPNKKIGFDRLISSEDWDIRSVLPHQNVESIPLTSALRTSASFPIILPNVELPTDPPAYLMDAGIRDNFGLLTTQRFLFLYRDWIAQNTGGVIILNIRDHQKKTGPGKTSSSLISKIQMPVSNIYDNLFRTQNYIQDKNLLEMTEWLQVKLGVISFELQTKKEEKVSLNFHLSPKAKNTIKEATAGEWNDEKIDWLLEQLKQ